MKFYVGGNHIMKNLTFFQKLIIITIFIIFVIAIIVNVTKKSDAEKIAEAVINQTYGITLDDCKKLTNAITQSIEDKTTLLKYLNSVYVGQMTENGCNDIIKNRVFSKAITTASEENSDLKVTSIQLESRDANKGSKRYYFTVKVETVKDITKIFTFKGNIVLIQEEGHWKVDGISPQ